MVKIEQIKYYDLDFNGVLGGGVNTINGNVTNKYRAVINFSVCLNFKNLNLTFIAATKEIKISDTYSTTDLRNEDGLLGYGLQVGRSIRVPLSVSNTGVFTIAEIKDFGKTLVVVESVSDETLLLCTIYDVTQINSVDLFYNIIPNIRNDFYTQENFSESIQKYSAIGIGSGGSSGSFSNMFISSPNNMWVTNDFVSKDTGEVSDVKIKRDGIINYEQKFIIEQDFIITPFFSRDLVKNIIEKTTPKDFTNDGSYKYICKINARINYSDANVAQYGFYNRLGSVCWFNQTNIKRRASYSVDSVEYKDASNNVLASIDIDKIVSVKVRIKTKYSTFSSLNKFILGFIYFPIDKLNEDTGDSSMNDLLMLDRATVTTSLSNGIYFGTANQVIKESKFTLINSNEVDVECKIHFSSENKIELKKHSLENRMFTLFVTCQNSSITTTEQADRVTVYTDVNKINWDRAYQCITAVENINIYHYPDLYSNPKNTIGGYEGDPFFAQFKFQLDTLSYGDKTATIKKVGYKVVAKLIGSTSDGHILEERFSNQEFERKLNGVQTIDSEIIYDYKDLPSEYSRYKIYRDETLDDANFKGFVCEAGFTLRYEFWKSLAEDIERKDLAIYRNVFNPTNAWHSLNSSYDLYLRFFCEVENKYGHEETFTQDWQITQLQAGTNAISYPNNFYFTLKTFDTESGLQIDGIKKLGRTKIVFECVGDLSLFTGDIYSYFFSDIEGSGGAIYRRIGSSEFDSIDTDCPFLSVDSDPSSFSGWKSDNVTVDVYTNKIVSTTIYDDSILKWSIQNKNILIYPRLGFFDSCYVRTEEGGYVLTEKGNRVKMEDCFSTI